VHELGTGAEPRRLRTNRNNTGKRFEEKIEQAIAYYRRKGILRAEHVDPPTVLVRGKLIRKANPFLDYVGVWTYGGGRALFFEAKSTSVPRLAISRDGGITERQYDALIQWRAAGAITFVLWEYDGTVLYVPVAQIVQLGNAGLHLRRDRDGQRVPCSSLGWPDFARMLSRDE
jgi:penicillin-binding protein-related factor A (putative recombinase)